MSIHPKVTKMTVA